MESFERFLLFAPIVLFSMVAHEYAHGYAALKQGDDTAQALGRLTWNPLKHIDPVLTVIMPAATWFLSNGSFIFGGAKPVPVNPGLYRHLRRGDIIVSLAGIVVNLVLAVLLTFAVIGLGLLGRGVTALAPSLALLQMMFQFGVFFNLLLAVFNLLPIPPLDGSHVMKYLLPPSWAVQYQRLAGMGFLILLVLLTVGRPIIMFWMTPVTYFGGISLRFVSPYLLPSPWTS